MSDEYNKKMENLNNVVKNTKKKPNGNNKKNNSKKKNNYRRNSQSYKKTPMPKKEEYDDEDDDDEDEEEQQNSSQNRRSNKSNNNKKKNNNNNNQNGQGNNGSSNGGSGHGAPGSKHGGKDGSNSGSGSGGNQGSGSGSGNGTGSGSGGGSGTGAGNGANAGNGAGSGGATGGGTGASGGAGSGASAGSGAGAGAGSGAGAGGGAAGAGAGSGAGAGAGSAAGAGAGSGAAAGTGAGAAAGGGAAGGAAATSGGVAIGTVLIWVVIAVVIILMLIGFLSFFISGVGLIRDQLLKFADGIWTNVYGFFVGQDKAQVKEEHIINVADYLEEMGYDLVNYGFLDTYGKEVTVEEGENGEETIKNSKGKTILKRRINDETGDLEITKIKSKYISAYLAAENNTYMISNQNFNMKHFYKNLFSADEMDSDKWGSGMITIEGMNQETLDSLTADAETTDSPEGSETSENPDTYQGQDVSNFGKSRNVKIDRENKKMIITRDNHVYQYDLDGWTGKYGKSIEFLLTLHLATMAPDFVYDIVTEDEFDTKVYVALYPVEASIEVVYKTGENEYSIIRSDNFGDFGLTQEEWDKIAAYNTDEAQLYTPFITKVINHWYKDLDFTGCYAEVENDPNTTEDDEKFTYYYPYVGLGEDDDVLANIENLYIREVRKNDFYQVSEPKTKKNELIKQMLLGSTDEEGSENTNKDYLYYLYTGSGMTGNQKEREKSYIIQKVSVGEDTKYEMNTKMFTYAFAILEEVHSEDAEFVLRDLKELFRDVEIDVEETTEKDEEEDDDGEIKPLTWPIEDYKPIVWDPIINGEDVKVNIRHQTEDTLGFEKGSKVVMPANGKVVSVNYGDVDEETEETSGDSVKIEFSGDDRDDLEKMYIYIYGIKANEGIENGLYTAGSEIGETIEQDIIIIMTDKNRKAITTVDKYIVPEDWEPLEETDEIGEESDFKNDVFGNGGTASIQGDYNVNTTSGENVFGREDIIRGLEWYAHQNPQGYQNIIDNMDYFMAIQSQYNVNAIFAISVAIAESGAGTGWAAIAPYTYNWMSMTGSYNGRSYISPTSTNRRTWRWYNSFGEATLDFGNVIANLPYYFKAGRNTVYAIETPYCPGENWGNRVNEYMTNTIRGIQQY